jgi:hypothetical protein
VNKLTLWFRRKYRLPPTDPRYLDATFHDIEVDYWANRYQDHADSGRPEEEEIEDEDFDLDEITREWAEAAEAGKEWEDVSFGRAKD